MVERSGTPTLVAERTNKDAVSLILMGSLHVQVVRLPRLENRRTVAFLQLAGLRAPLGVGFVGRLNMQLDVTWAAENLPSNGTRISRGGLFGGPKSNDSVRTEAALCELVLLHKIGREVFVCASLLFVLARNVVLGWLRTRVAAGYSELYQISCAHLV